MAIYDRHIKTEYQQMVLRVQHYITKNLAEDLSLETLATVANYSLFHFQKIFSEVVSESPKQYVIRLRLERAAHFIKIFPQLPINEIAANCGFSSNSIFSRAFKNYFGISAEKYRELPTDKISEISKNMNQLSLWTDASWIIPITDIQQKVDAVKLTTTPIVKTIYSFQLASIQTTLGYPENIAFAFQNLLQWAEPRGLITPTTKYFGVWLDFPFITPPDKCRYLCGIEINADVKLTKGINSQTISKAQYLRYDMKGSMNETLDVMLALNHKHMETMGYVISEMICYEQFDECPSDKPYEEICRNLLFPVRMK
ncbi:MAG: AraC family transcriptional regulator [Bacteroidales bacterium]